MKAREVNKEEFSEMIESIDKHKNVTDAHRKVLLDIKDRIQFEAENEHFLIVEKDDLVVGLGICTLGLMEPENYYIDDVVSVEKGAGKAMTEWVLELSRKQNPRKPIDLVPGNQEAIEYWKGQGFIQPNPPSAQMTRRPSSEFAESEESNESKESANKPNKNRKKKGRRR
ncbi:GNAT family N-acetyltransferase [Ascidiimonas sp. W6]|uniref:GNAT family N-acetyltransferase n=1 Tax=Ascidiimonas meishanensis TaxID=3128903 RepID=UPI0030EF183D